MFQGSNELLGDKAIISAHAASLMPSVTRHVPYIHGVSAEGDGGEGFFGPFYSFMLVLILGLARASPALALFKKKKQKADTIDEYSSRLVKLYWPIMANLGFSGAVGLATGLALRVCHLPLAFPTELLTPSNGQRLTSPHMA